MHGAIPPLPQYAFMTCCLVKHRSNFIFTFIRFLKQTSENKHFYFIFCSSSYTFKRRKT